MTYRKRAKFLNDLTKSTKGIMQKYVRGDISIKKAKLLVEIEIRKKKKEHELTKKDIKEITNDIQKES